VSDMPQKLCPCPLCIPGAPEAYLEEVWSGEVRHIREHGWHVVGIGGDDMPDWVFTVGLWHSYRVPEVAMFGLEVGDLMCWANAAGARLRDGAAPDADSLLTGVVEGLPLMIKTVDPSWHKPLFGTAVGYYQRTPVPFVQLVWPDRDGNWPWDQDATRRCREYQPRLWLPVDAHPTGVWTEEALR
jgi:hypothetical protein